ncbi:MAG: hypothetical protein AAFV29_10780 [Myxococcota bacterium]
MKGSTIDPATLDDVIAFANKEFRLIHYFPAEKVIDPTSGRTVLDSFLEGERLKSFWETGTSGGFSSVAARGEAEEKMGYKDGRQIVQKESSVPESGVLGKLGKKKKIKYDRVEYDPKTVDAKKRPIYTIVSSENMAPKDSQYGKSRLILKRDVHQRTSIAPSDSIGSKPLSKDAKELTMFENPEAVLANVNGEVFMELVEAATGRLSGTFNKDATARTSEYMEAQVHNGVSLADVAVMEISTPITPEQRKSLEAASRKYGFELRIHENGGVTTFGTADD